MLNKRSIIILIAISLTLCSICNAKCITTTVYYYDTMITNKRPTVNTPPVTTAYAFITESFPPATTILPDEWHVISRKSGRPQTTTLSL